MAFSWSLSFALFCILQALPVLGNPNCPIYGPEFPKPRNLAEGEAWKAAMKNLSATFDSVEAGGQNYSFSVQVFSTNPGPPILFERFHTADTIPSNTTGVKKIDADTVYRIGSVTKLFTALTFLAEAGDKHWNQPITDFIPELAEMTTADPSRGGVRYVDWSDVNVLSLLSQMSGIERDYMVLGEVVGSINASDAITMGFPPLAAEPPCGKNPLCNRTQFFEGMKTMYPSFAPWTTPAYSDIAFQLLSYVLENITSRPFNVSLAEKVLKPLGLSHTFLQGANESMGIVPRLSDSRSWKVHIGDLNPSGNIFSSAGDMSKFGMAVLNSTLLKPVLTRRWLKPMSYSSDIVAAVGAPWGLRRLHLSSVNPHRTVTAFTKAGGVDPYSALLTIIPEFNIGFTVLIAGGDTAGLIWKFIDYLTGAVVPALDAASRDDADARYGGEYRAEGLNSSLTIDTDPSKPGLGVSNWLSNGTNMIVSALTTQSGMAVPSEPNALNSTQPSTRLYFTGLESPSASGKVLQSFKAIFETLGGPSNPGTGISTDCGTWIGYTGVTYAGLPLDEFIFELNSAGDALSVTNLALNVTLIRVKK